MSQAEQTYDLSLLQQSHQKWERSHALRCYYQSLYKDMLLWCPEGEKRLEIGSGIGVAKQFIPYLTTSDIVLNEYVDQAASAYDLAPENHWEAILGLDVLHHLRYPMRFFESAARSLEPGGRIILMEPAATRFGNLLYGLCHHEPMKLAEIQPPFVFDEQTGDEAFSNMAMAQGLFRVHHDYAEKKLAAMNLHLIHLSYRDVLAYFLTGGFSRPALLPAWLIRIAVAVEKLLPNPFLRILGVRMLVVVEKQV